MKFEHVKMGHYILDESNNPVSVDLRTWAEWIGDPKNKIVEQNTVGSFWVSTVFLGLDHRFGGEGEPLLWETMIFPEATYEELYCQRYTSYKEAINGHELAVLIAEQMDKTSRGRKFKDVLGEHGRS
jgi:hypothetical protein